MINKELFEKRFNRARYLCFQLLNSHRSSVTHLETLTRINKLIHTCVSYSDFFRNQLGNVPDSSNNLSLLDKHDQEVKDIQKLKSLVLSISNNTEGQGVSEIPTTTQTITFIENMEKGMSVR